MTPAERLDDAYQSFAHDNAEDYGSPDWHNAYEYREEGYAIAEQAALISDECEREDFTESEIAGCDRHAHYLIACAVAFRLSELDAMAAASAMGRAA